MDVPRPSQTLILTEAIIDALTLYEQGFKNVMPIYGVNGLLDEHLIFFHHRSTTEIQRNPLDHTIAI